MKLKIRILAVLLVLCLIGTAQPVSAKTIFNRVLKVGSAETYHTVTEALNAAVNGDVISLSENIVESVSYTVVPEKTVTIRGNGHSITAPSNNTEDIVTLYALELSGSGTIKLDNISMVGGSGTGTNTRSTGLLMDNSCNIAVLGGMDVIAIGGDAPFSYGMIHYGNGSVTLDTFQAKGTSLSAGIYSTGGADINARLSFSRAAGLSYGVLQNGTGTINLNSVYSGDATVVSSAIIIAKGTVNAVYAEPGTNSTKAYAVYNQGLNSVVNIRSYHGDISNTAIVNTDTAFINLEYGDAYCAFNKIVVAKSGTTDYGTLPNTYKDGVFSNNWYKDSALTTQFSDNTVSGETTVYSSFYSSTASPMPTSTPIPGSGATPTPTPIPGSGATPTPTSIPGSGATPTPTSIPGPGTTPTPTPIPGSGTTPTPTSIPGSGTTPTPTSIPGSGAIPTPTPIPGSGDIPTITPAPGAQPFIENIGITGWTDIINTLRNSGQGTSFTIDMMGSAIVPANVWKAAYEKKEKLTFQLPDDIQWLADFGSSVNSDLKPQTFSDTDLSVNQNSTNIPQETIIYSFGSERTKQLSLIPHGDFGFTAELKTKLGTENTGKKASLFYYNPATKLMDLQSASAIDSQGCAVLSFTHASDYVIVISDNVILKDKMRDISISPDKKTLYTGGNTGKTVTLEVKLPAVLQDAVSGNLSVLKVAYQSSNPKVASVTANGVIKAKKPGKATITATVTIDGEKITAETTISVKKAYITITKSKASLKKGTSFTFAVKGYGVSAGSITWKSSKSSVLTVNSKTGKVKAKAKGTAYITAVSGNIIKKIKVIVK